MQHMQSVPPTASLHHWKKHTGEHDAPAGRSQRITFQKHPCIPLLPPSGQSINHPLAASSSSKPTRWWWRSSTSACVRCGCSHACLLWHWRSSVRHSTQIRLREHERKQSVKPRNASWQGCTCDTAAGPSFLHKHGLNMNSTNGCCQTRPLAVPTLAELQAHDIGVLLNSRIGAAFPSLVVA